MQGQNIYFPRLLSWEAARRQAAIKKGINQEWGIHGINPGNSAQEQR